MTFQDPLIEQINEMRIARRRRYATLECIANDVNKGAIRASVPLGARARRASIRRTARGDECRKHKITNFKESTTIQTFCLADVWP
jgi:hypothetical protein